MRKYLQDPHFWGAPEHVMREMEEQAERTMTQAMETIDLLTRRLNDDIVLLLEAGVEPSAISTKQGMVNAPYNAVDPQEPGCVYTWKELQVNGRTVRKYEVRYV